MDLFCEEFEDKKTKDTLLTIVETVSKFNVYDFVSRVAGLNLMSENQNKSVLLDTLLQYILTKEESYYRMTNKMSAGKFKTVINDLNSTFLSASIDPCENVFVQNVMFGRNYRVFNGIDTTPAYNLQILIRVLFEYQNNFEEQYLKKVYKLFSFILGISEEIAEDLAFELNGIKYDEQKTVILPANEDIKKYSERVALPISKVKRFIDGYFQIEDIASEFGNAKTGNLDNRPFYQKPFLINRNDEKVIMLNISLLPAFAFYKAIEWAEEFGIKQAVVNKYNDYAWLETKKTLDKLGHKKINERALGIECVSKDYYKEMLVTVYNNQLMAVIFVCDDAYRYTEKGMHAPYPDERHNNMFQERLKYWEEKIEKLDIPKDDWYMLIVMNSFGRGFGLSSDYLPFGYFPIHFNLFELHCVSIKERESDSFLPRYIRAKNQINTILPNMFSELNSICIYTKNNRTFYVSDDIDPDIMNLFVTSGDSIDYITEALTEENRMLIDSYIDGEKTEVILTDKIRNIYIEDKLYQSKYLAFCIVYNDVKIWIKTEEIEDFQQVNMYCSMVDAISYWLAESKEIVESFDLPYCVYVLNLSLTHDIIEYYYQRDSVLPYSECIDKTISKNHIFLGMQPESFCNMSQKTNLQEKELCKFIFDIFNEIAYEIYDYNSLLDKIFSNPLKKKFFSFDYQAKPYLKPFELSNNRKVHDEDEDYLAGLLGRELLQTGEWEIGIVPDEKRDEISHVVVNWLYQRLQSNVAEFSAENMLEIMYFDLEDTLYKLLLLEERFYSDIACYPEKEDLYLEEYNNLNRTSLALKFLVEYVTAQPPAGKKQFGIGQYEELLAICSMIIEWAYKGDLFKYEIINTPIEFLQSRRIGLKKDEFIDMYHYGDIYRRQQLRYNSSSITRKKYHINSTDYSDEIVAVYEKEFGYTYLDFVQVIATMIELNEGEIACFAEKIVPSKLVTLNDSLRVDIINKVVEDITYRPREDYLVLPAKYKAWEAYPWRFNRRYSFNRRPVLQRGDTLIWGNRQLYYMLEYVQELIYSGKFYAESKEMNELLGKISKNKGAAFNELILKIINDMNEFEVFPNVKKVNGLKISDSKGNDLGDIDILIIDSQNDKIIVAEVKDFHFSRNPYEIQQEYIKMFVDKGKKACFATKHNRRVEWVREHILDVKEEYGLDNREWSVDGVFIVSEPLISNQIYKQNIKCISRAELCPEAIREI